MSTLPLPARSFFILVRDAALAWSDDHASSMGAAIAYYTALSIAPLVLIVLAIAGLVFGEDAARGALFQQLSGLIGDDGAKAIQSIVAGAKNTGGSLASIAISVGILLVGATTVFVELQNDLDRIWKAKPPEGSGVINFLLSRLLSFGILLAVGFLLTVSLVSSTVIAAIGSFWGEWLGGAAVLVETLNVIVGIAIITLLFAMIFRFLPRAEVKWSDVWLGALLTSVLFSVGRIAIGFYIGHSAFASAFGAAGTFVVIIVWIYYAAQIFLFGAEFTSQYARRLGSPTTRASLHLSELASAEAPESSSGS